MKVENCNWKGSCLEQWDQQCLQSNKDILNSKRKSDTDTQLSNETEDSFKGCLHYITQNDTLEGLSLIYDVPISDIRAANKLQSDSIYFKQSLVIPNRTEKKKRAIGQEKVQKIKEVREKLRLQNDPEKMAEKLLEQCAWDSVKAVRKYKQDIQWKKRYEWVLKVFQKN